MLFAGIGNGAGGNSGNWGSTNNAALLSTKDGTGISDNVSVLPLSGHLMDPITLSYSFIGAPVVNFYSRFAGAMQTFPAPVTFTKMSATLALDDLLLALNGNTVAVRAQLYKQVISGGGNVVSAMPGAFCDFVQAGVGVPTITFNTFTAGGTLATCSNSAFSAAFNAGEAGFWLITATTSSQAAAPISAQTLHVDVSIGLSQ
jgi:hypothetical protein